MPIAAPLVAALDPKTFVDFTVKSVEKLTHDTSRFRFSLPEGSYLGMAPDSASCLVTKFIGSDNKAVIRPYTPIEKVGSGYFDLVVKTYPDGKMSKHIHSLERGSILQMKGPIEKYVFKNDASESWIGMLAGGTGITPMIQVIDRFISNGFKLENGESKISLIYANRGEEDIIMKSYLDEIASKYPRNFKVVYTISNPVDEKLWKGETGRIHEGMIQKHMPPPGKGKVFVCGPPGQMIFLSGPKAEDKSQGKLDGVLKKLGYNEDDVYKF